MKKEELIDDIVAMLDNSVSNGTGHLNVAVNLNENSHNAAALLTKTIQTSECLDCAAGDLACSVPTLHEGLDTENK